MPASSTRPRRRIAAIVSAAAVAISVACGTGVAAPSAASATTRAPAVNAPAATPTDATATDPLGRGSVRLGPVPADLGPDLTAGIATLKRRVALGPGKGVRDVPFDTAAPSGAAAAARTSQIGARIIGGSGAAVGQFPSFAAVIVADTSGATFLCGGSVIAPNVVLSAGHCFEGNIRAARVFTGWNGGGGSPQAYVNAFSQSLAVSAYNNSWFNPSTFDNDYALLYLPIATVAPVIPLVHPGQEALWATGQNLTVAGAGATVNGAGAANTVNFVSVPRQNDSYCGGPSSYGADFLASSMFCAGPLDGSRDSCQGDSGGPIMVAGPSGWIQVGIVSWGLECAQAGYPGVYTRLANFSIGINRAVAPFDLATSTAVNFGAPGDIPLPAKWNGGTTAARGLFRPSSGRWFVYGQNPAGIAFGGPGDTPVPGDYNGDATTDRGIFRAATGTWYLDPVAPGGIPFGSPGDIPMAGDLDANGTADLVVFRPSTGTWYARNPNGTSYQEFRYGQPGDIALLRSWTGTGAQATIYRPSTGTWYVRGVADAGVRSGAAGDVPLGANFAGAANAEISLYRPSGSRFFIDGLLPGGGAFGVTGDQPVPADYAGTGTDQAAVFRAANGTWYSVGLNYLG